MRRIMSILAAVVFLSVAVVPAASAAPTAYIQFRAAFYPGYCLSAEGGRMVNGTKAIQYPCNSAYDQQWVVQGDTLRSRKDQSFCLSSPNNWTSLGLQLIIWKCQGSIGAPGQQWEPGEKDGQQVIENRYFNRVAGVSGSSTAAGAAVVQWTWTGNHDQIWFRNNIID